MNNNPNDNDNRNVYTPHPTDDPVVNPSHAVGPNGESSSPQYVPVQQPKYMGPQPGRQLSMIGMILGIASIVLALVCNFFAFTVVLANIMDIVAILCGIGGIVLGVMGGNQNAAVGAPRGSFAIAAVVCGAAGIVLGGISFACIAVCNGVRGFVNGAVVGEW